MYGDMAMSMNKLARQKQKESSAVTTPCDNYVTTAFLRRLMKLAKHRILHSTSS